MQYESLLIPTRDLSKNNTLLNKDDDAFLGKYFTETSEHLEVLETFIRMLNPIENTLHVLMRFKAKYYHFKIPVSNETGNPAIKISIRGLEEDVTCLGFKELKDAISVFEESKCH